jgi:catechol 2,3-dioxygenase-like lactoylglutathione lyase family enzyme
VKIFRITLEVSNIDEAAVFYAKLLGTEGKRHPGARHYFDCGAVILSVLDRTAGGLTPTPGPKSLYFAVRDLEAVHTRARGLKALAPYKVHGEPAGTVTKRPWGERSFYVVDPWGNVSLAKTRFEDWSTSDWPIGAADHCFSGEASMPPRRGPR